MCLCLLSHAQATYTTNYTTYQNDYIAQDAQCETAYGSQNCWVAAPGPSGVTINKAAGAQDGTLVVTGTNGHVYLHTTGTNNWTDISYNNAGNFSRVAVADANHIYSLGVANKTSLYNSSTHTWVELTNDILMRNISVGSDGDLWAVAQATTAVDCGYQIYHRNTSNNTWATTSFGGVQVAVANANDVMYQCSNGTIKAIVNGASVVYPNANAAQTALGGDGALWFLAGSPATTPYAAYMRDTTGDFPSTAAASNCCYQVNGSGSFLAVGSVNGIYLVNNGALYFYNDKTVTVSDGVQGTTTCSGQGCPGPLGTGTQHTGNVTVQVPSSGQPKTNVSAVTWSSYLQVSAYDTTTPQYQGGCVWTFTAESNCSTPTTNNADVTCPFMGTVQYQSASATTDTEDAETLAITSTINPTPYNCVGSGNTQHCFIDTQNWCTLATTPPDMDMSGGTGVDSNPGYGGWMVYGQCERQVYTWGHTIWKCLRLWNTPAALKGQGQELMYYPCTYNP